MSLEDTLSITYLFDHNHMLKKTILFICGIGLAAAAIIILRYLNPQTTEISTDIKNIQATNQNIEIQIIATGLVVPRSIAFTSPERLLVTERPGRVRVVENNILLPDPLITIANISNTNEEWLMSITLDLDYPTNKFVYMCYAYTDSDTMFVRVSRRTDGGDVFTEEKIIIDQLPAAKRHAWCALAFGPDKKLYITVGDAIEWEKAQYPDYFNGKVLRLNTDGSVPSDNPYHKSPVRSIGHRNSQGIDRDTKGNMYASEHGPSTFDGQPGGDEINHIIRKGNYGWNKVSHEKNAAWFIAPIAIFTPAIAPSGLHIYKWDMFTSRKDNLLVAMLKGAWVLKIQIDPNNIDKVVHIEKIIGNEFGRIRNITTAPDGSIYITTSNRDQKWSVQEGDDKIIRIFKKI